VARFHATLGLPGVAARAGEAAPRLIHFCLCHPAMTMDGLDEDGHPTRGRFLPPVPLPRRMWASSSIAFMGDLLVGDPVRRVSRIAEVVAKEGRTGQLCFVTIDHEILTASDIVAVSDRQTIVYRENEGVLVPPGTAPPAPRGTTTVAVDPSSALLFRYSALTFNSHRIHYDFPYATQVEGYPGLVVQGPLQATMLLNLAARIRGRAPDRFEFRAVSPLFAGTPICLHADSVGNGQLNLWSSKPGGPTAMDAKANWV
jgi:3-methylfumaryl-CoA hydratase